MRSVLLVALLALTAGIDLVGQTTVAVTSVLPAPQVPISAARDLFIDLDSGTLRAQVPTGIDSNYPSQFARVSLTADNRFMVGAYLRIPVSLPSVYPASYRDLLTGATGSIGTDVFRLVAHPRRPVVYLSFTNGDVGLLGIDGLRRVRVCEQNPSALAVARDGGQLYVACFDSLRVLDSVTLAELRRFTLSASPRWMYVVAGGRLFTLDSAGPVPLAVMEMSVYDTESGHRLANAPTPVSGGGLLWAVPWPGGSHVVVGVGASASGFEATPFIVDSLTLNVLGTWPLDRVTMVAFTADEQRAVALREIPEPSGFDRALEGVLLHVPSRTVVAAARLGVVSYPGMANVLILEPPQAPDALVAEVIGARVTLRWTMPEVSRVASDYIVEAGSTPASFTLLSQRLGSDAQQFVARDVPSGVYYARVRALNATGVGPPSPVVDVRVP